MRQAVSLVRRFLAFLIGLSLGTRRKLELALQELLNDVDAGRLRAEDLAEVLLDLRLTAQWRAVDRTAADRRQVAYHEASHAIMGLALGVEFSLVTMQPNALFGGFSQGHVMFCRHPQSTRDEAEAAVLITLAGPVGEQLAGFDPASAARHFDEARASLLPLELSQDEVALLLPFLRQRAETLLRRRWRHVVAVAEALIEHESLSQADVAALTPDPLPTS